MIRLIFCGIIALTGVLSVSGSVSEQGFTLFTGTGTDTVLAGDTVVVAMDSVTGAQGNPVMIPVRVQQFNRMVSIQGTIEWDTLVAGFVAVDSFGLMGMNANSFGTSLTADGLLTFSWNDNSLQGVDLPDSAVVFSIQFDVLSGPGTETSLDFVNSPTTLEFADTSFAAVPLHAVAGQIEVPDTMTTRIVQEVATPFLQVFPNPVTDQTRIMVGPGVEQLEILNLQGQSVKRFAPEMSPLHWKGTDANGQRLPSGLYWLMARTPHTLETVKIYLNQKP